MTTSPTLGFRITGYVIKRKDGSVLQIANRKYRSFEEKDIPTIFSKVLSGNEKNEINKEALAFFKERTSELLDYFENHNSRRIRGSSILFLVDNTTNSYDMKIIDPSSTEDFADLNQRDEGYIKGLKSI